MLCTANELLSKALTWLRAGIRVVTGPCAPVSGLAKDLWGSRAQLVAENILLRQQLIVLHRRSKRPRLSRWDRFVMLAAARFAEKWREVTLIVKPETVLKWHRAGFRLFWRFKSRPREPKLPQINSELIQLIRRMAVENPLWGAERIRGELLKLGIRVAKRTVQKYMRVVRPPRPRHDQSWQTFLRNHSVWACDFLQTYDIWFRPIFAFFIVDISTRAIVGVNVTRRPTAAWTAQQIRNATPFGKGPRFILRDRDSKFGAAFDRAAPPGTRVIRTAFRAPNMNAVAERFIGSVRRECLDHVIILSEGHFRRVLSEYVQYFNESRPHQALGQRIPAARKRLTIARKVMAVPVLGGLHHDYRWVG